ncbi:tubulin epsilon and delta complex protein 1 [Nematostella vectensis]|uniref:tubulin epsilon and delta complex protein 1 n=1 Tax=Nematostella vectensis TaxID=45351 RepID=UPI00207722B6|nr:tubulin epsilon and delta complex protein 1 [Nematostella vectensis]
MTQIRETIENLCRVLKYNSIASITAEVFRLAKFDKPEATKEMWISLANLLEWLEREQDPTNSPPCGLADSAIAVRLCKHKMYLKGYRAPGFYLLLEDMQVGSRTILLAFGWLMAKEEFFRKLLKNVSPCLETEELPHKDCLCSNELKDSLFDHSKGMSPLQILQAVVWMKGKICSASRSLLTARDELAILTNKIHMATCKFPPTCSMIRHLSLFDVYLLSQPKILAQRQDTLDKHNSYLQSLLSVKTEEASFWKWMESVLDLQLKEDDENGPENDESKTLFGKIHGFAAYKPSKQVQEIKEQQVKMTKELHKYEKLYKKISKQHKMQRQILVNCPEMSQKFNELLPFIDQEICKEFQQLCQIQSTLDHRSKILFERSPCAVTLAHNKSDKKHSKDITTVLDQSDIAIVAGQVEQEVKVLREKMDALSRKHQDQMAELSQLLNDVVCITHI